MRENLNAFGKISKVQNFFVPIENKVTKIDKDGNKSLVTIYYKIKFIDSARFMATLLSNLVNSVIEKIRKIISKDFDCSLKYGSVKEN